MSKRIIITGAREMRDFDRAKSPDVYVVIEGNSIVNMGHDDGNTDLDELKGSDCQHIDAKGAYVFPGFYESHMHLFTGGVSLSQLNLLEILGFDALKESLRDHAKRFPNEPVVAGYSANYTIIGEDKRLDRHVLDEIISDRPIYVISVDYHTAWANTIALEKAGILEGKPLSGEACIVMGSDGLATGELREFEAMEFVNKLTLSGGRELLGISGDEPKSVSDAEREADINILKQGIEYCVRHGITKIINMDGNVYLAELLSTIENRNELICRVDLPFVVKAETPANELKAIHKNLQQYAGEKLTTGRFKLFMDGVFDNWTAFVTDHYPDRPDFAGKAFVDKKPFADICIAAEELDAQVCVHAVGDGAVRAVLDGYEAARKQHGRRDTRHRVEHIDTISDADIGRFQDLGVIASMQPVHPPGSAGLPLEPTVGLMGRERWKNAFAWRTLWDRGAIVAFSTDWPVSPLNPFYAIQCAMTREPWDKDLPDQRLTLDECFVAYTKHGAYASFDEDQLGALEIGKRADLALVQGDLRNLCVAGGELPECVLTICDGKIIYQNSEF